LHYPPRPLKPLSLANNSFSADIPQFRILPFGIGCFLNEKEYHQPEKKDNGSISIFNLGLIEFKNKGNREMNLLHLFFFGSKNIWSKKKERLN
jgi:hypothetical protein